MADFNYSVVGIVTTTSVVGYTSSLLYQPQSTTPYTQTVSVGGTSPGNIPGSGSNVTAGLFTIQVSNVGLSIFSPTTTGINTSKNYIVQSSALGYVYTAVISYIPEPYPYQQLSIFTLPNRAGVDTTKNYRIQSTSPYTQTVSVGGTSPGNIPGSGSNVTAGLFTIQVSNVGLSVFGSFSGAVPGYPTDNRPSRGQIFPRSYGIINRNTSGILSVSSGPSSGPSGVISKTRSGYKTGKRNPIGLVFPRGTKLTENN